MIGSLNLLFGANEVSDMGLYITSEVEGAKPLKSSSHF